MQSFDSELEFFFDALKKNNRERTLVEARNSLIDLCSNDYLGLSQHPELIAALHEGIDMYGAGSTASRLVRGHRSVFDSLEKKFAAWLGAESALFFANGYAANVGSLSVLLDASHEAFIDRLAHASLVDGVRLSGAKKIYFRHNDLIHLEALLQKSKASRKMIITESLFSMDGDRAPLHEMQELSQKYDALFYVDDAHALGLYGKAGAGLAEASVDFRMATLGKALGLEGAMLATTHNARKYLLHKARPFVFSTAPLPAIAHAGLTAISLAGSMDSERAHVASLSGRVRALLQQKGFSTGSSTTHIIPLLFNSEIEALWYADTLEKRNLHVKAIRPPTVPTPRLRFSMNARVSENVLFQLDEAFA